MHHDRSLCRRNWSVLHPFDLDLMNLLANLDHLYDECKRNQWLRYFAVFCRVALALGFTAYFPIIFNICVLAYATRFEGTHHYAHGVGKLVIAVLGLRAVEIRSALCVIEQRRDNTKSEDVPKVSLGIFWRRCRSRRRSDHHQRFYLQPPAWEF